MHKELLSAAAALQAAAKKELADETARLNHSGKMLRLIDGIIQTLGSLMVINMAQQENIDKLIKEVAALKDSNPA